MNPRIEGGLLLAAGVVIGSGLMHLQGSAAVPAPREVVREERRVERPVIEPVCPQVVVAAPTPAPSPVPAPVVTQKPASARLTLKPAGNRLNRVPSSALASLRRPHPGVSKALAYELAMGTRALERGTAYTAYSHFLQASKFDPKNADALMGIALCHFELDQRGATKRALAKVFAIDANHPEASILSGFIAQVAHDSSVAADWYQRALIRADAEVASELQSVLAQLETSSNPTATALAK